MTTATAPKQQTTAERRAEAAKAKENDERAKKAATKARASSGKSTPTRSTAKATKAAQKKTQAPAKRPEPQAVSTYAPEDVAKQLADAVAGFRALGWTRPKLAEVFGMTTSAAWRVEHKKTRTDEIDAVRGGLEKIQKGEVALPTKPTSGGRPKGPSNADLLAKIVELENKIDALTVLLTVPVKK